MVILSVKDSFAFAEEILRHDGKPFMGSLDVEVYWNSRL